MRALALISRSWLRISLIGLLFSPGTLPLSAQATGAIAGQVADPTGAVIPAANVTVTSAAGAASSAKSDGLGSFRITGLAPGSYSVQVTADGFAQFSSPPVSVTANGVARLNVELKVEVEEQKIDVSVPETQLDVNPASNASALVLKGKDLDALSDDPDELQAELQALAGPAAGPNGGQIYIDGFTRGQLPPKSSIREIRINQNPFSAEFDKLGYGRIEIFTKPGTDRFHGQASFTDNSSIFNARNPFIAQEPSYHTEMYEANFGGPMSKRSSFLLSFERRDIGDQSSVNAIVLDPNFLPTPFQESVANPRVRTNAGLRLDFQLGANDTLTARYQFVDVNEQNNGIGQFSLASQGYDTHNIEHTLQVSDTHIFGPKVVNETCFQFIRADNEQQALQSGASINVIGAFDDGGNPLGTSRSVQDRYELQNITSIVAGSHYVRFGGRLRTTRQEDASTQGFNGTFTFDSIDAYRITQQGLAAGMTATQIRAAGGGASQFTLSAGNPRVASTYVDFGGFIQDDWKIRPNMVLSPGLRYETQSSIGDRGDLAPRIEFAWGIDGKGNKAPKTVLRVGGGIFYDRFTQDLVMQVNRLNGTTQQRFIVNQPDFFPNVPDPSTLSGVTVQPTVYRIGDDVKAPWVAQEGISLERQLTKTATVTATYLHSHGERQLLSRNFNAPFPGTYDPGDPTSGVRPLGDIGNVYEYISKGKYEQNQFITNFNLRVGTKVSLFGYYTLNYANTNSGGAGSFSSDPYNINADWGRAGYDVRHRFFLGGNISLPYKFSVAPFLVVTSGRPFNITLGKDLNGDSIFNDRPAFATDLSSATVVASSFGDFDTSPVAGEPLVPINYGGGPSQATLNLRVSKTFGFGPKAVEGSGAPQGRGVGGFGGRGGGAFGRGGGGRPGGAGAVSDRRYNLTFSVQARNLLNTVNLANPVGNLSSPLFGESIALAGGPFNSQTANRRISLEVQFRF